MGVLILGGTVFLGRALVAAAQEQGHEVAILSRGRSGAERAAEVRRYAGQRPVAVDDVVGEDRLEPCPLVVGPSATWREGAVVGRELGAPAHVADGARPAIGRGGSDSRLS